MRLHRALQVAWCTAALAVSQAWAPLAAAQPQAQTAEPSVTVYAVDSENYPSIIAYLAVTDGLGRGVVGLSPADLELLVDDQPQEGGPVKVSSDQPTVAVALALDVSVDFASFTQMQAAAKDFVAAMGPDDQAAVIVYQSDVVVAQPFTSDQASLNTAIDGLTAEGTATNLNRAVSQAITLTEELETDRKAVVAITNGGDTVGAVATDAVTRQAAEVGVPIYTLVFAPTVNVTALGNMARQSGGRPFVLNGAGEVGDTLDTIAGGLRQGYAVSFETSLPADDADHNLTIVATVEGQEAQAETTFLAVQVATPITLMFSVAEGQTVIGAVNLTAQVASATPITRVEYFIDGQPIAQLSAPPYSFQWNSASVPAGSHVLTARATDNGGRTGEAQVSLVVAEVTPLLVTASAPRTIESGSAVTVEARVDTSAPGVVVEFLLDGEVLGQAETAPYTFIFDSAPFESGDHNITVRARDSLGRQADNNVSIQFTPRPVGFGERVTGFFSSLARFKLLAFRVLMAVLILIVLLAAMIILRMNGRSKQRRLQRTCVIEITNTGNARSRFQLWAEDAAKVLKFQFALDGQMMEVHTPPAAQPAAAARPAQTQAPASRPQAAPARPKRGNDGASRAWSIGMAVSDLLNTVAHYLPGSAGRGIYQASSGMRQAQYTGNRVNTLQRQTGAVRGAAGAPAGAATIVDAPPPPMSDPTRPGPVAPARRAQPANTRPWVETPYVEPGESLAVNLNIDRLKTSGIQQYPFQVHSRCIEEQGKPSVEQGVIELGRLPPLLSLMPVLVLLAAAGIVLLLIALLLAPPGFVS